MPPLLNGVTGGTRTHNHGDHNPALYQLSYRHIVLGEGIEPTLTACKAAASPLCQPSLSRAAGSCLLADVNQRYADADPCIGHPPTPLLPRPPTGNRTLVLGLKGPAITTIAIGGWSSF